MDGPDIVTALAARPARVTVVRALRLGDLLCAVPALRALRAALPRAEITLIGLPLAREFVRRCRYVDRFAEFPGYPGIAHQAVQPARTVAFLARMQHYGFDLSVQLYGSGAFSNPFTRLLGAQRMVGFTRVGETDLGLDVAIPYPAEGHEIHRLLTLTRALGAPETGDHTEIDVLATDRAELDADDALWGLFDGRRPVVGLHPGATVATRRWRPERFAAVGDWLAERYDAALVLTGGADEWATCERVRSLMRSPALNAAGCTNLGKLAALLARLDLVVSNDSGPAHLAVAVGTPTVVIFGAAQARDWAPLDRARHYARSVEVPCRPCYLSECPIGYRCLTGVAVGAVTHAAATLLDAAR